MEQDPDRTVNNFRSSLGGGFKRRSQKGRYKKD